MTKKYVTTVTTEWEVRGDVPVDRIQARIRLALGGLMMTSEDGSNYAFTGNEHLLELETKESKGLPKLIENKCLICGCEAVAMDDSDNNGKSQVQWCENGHVAILSPDHAPSVQQVFDFSENMIRVK